MSEDRRKILNNKKRNIKSQITLFANYLNPFNENPKSVNEEIIKNISKRLDKIQPLFEEFSDTLHELEMLEPETESDLSELESFQNKYFDVIAKAEIFVAKFNANTCKSESEIDDQSNRSRSLGSALFQRNNIKLPIIDIPKFDGTFTAWRQFADIFTTIIHNNQDLPNCHKLCYLRTSLKGEPANMINSLETTDANYEIAWNSLKERYDNKRRIVYNHIHALLNLNEIQKESHVNLRQFLDEIQSHIQCLNSLVEPTNQWDSLMVSIALKKLDSKSITAWESKLSLEHNHEYLPTYDDLIEFLKKRQGVLEAIQTTNPVKQANKFDYKPKQIKAYASATKLSCAVCSENHFVQNCESFLKLDPNNRYLKAKTLRLCTNCLKKGHYASSCQSSSCRLCQRRHHTTLHTISKQFTENTPTPNEEQIQSQNITPSPNITEQKALVSYSTLSNPYPVTEVLLATALVYVTDATGNLITLRAILDSAAQSNFISEAACKRLGLEKEPANILLTGITQTCTSIKYNVTLKLSSKYSNFKTEILCGVLPRVSTTIPNSPITISDMSIPDNLQLADPTFRMPGEIDLLIGGSLFWKLLLLGKIKTSNGLTYFNTQLGWIITGEVENQTRRCNVSLLSLTTLNSKLEEFWKMDETPPIQRILTPEEEHCENHFTETTTRAPDGKFIVKYPFKPNIHELGNSLEVAKQRFFSLERRFAKDETFKRQYSDCLKEYLDEKHAEITTFDNDSFYLPHHAVIKNESTTTKLRIVFDGSCKLDSGLSVNQIQLKGPVIQSDLMAIILRFRMHQYVLTGDIARMYRQVWVNNEDCKFQKIVWRDEPDKPLECITLKTVTFGMTAAPYLATRCVLQVAQINEDTYPIESNIIKEDLYVDDCLTGAKSINELKIIQQNLIKILQQAGFPLRKFRSNVPELDENKEDCSPFAFSTFESNKALGVIWNPKDDQFHYSLVEQNTSRISKRTILSMTAQLWDPLGLIAPIIIIPKLIIQDIWKSNIDWDDDLPEEIQQKWLRFRYDLKEVWNIIIPRHVIISEAIKLELHGFSDASERAYGCCIYIKSTNTNNECQVNLLIAKSRVAPVKILSIPRLELLAATLLADLMVKVKQILNAEIHEEVYWTDSMIVLAWLKAHSSKWTTFVANRVATIQRVTNIDQWHHVKSENNPADLISRGVFSSNLVNLKLWWKGPEFVRDNWKLEDSTQPLPEEIPETKTKSVNALLIVNDEFLSLLTNHSSLRQSTKIMAWGVRFINNSRMKNPSQRNISKTLSYAEIDHALCLLIKLNQKRYFSLDYEQLSKRNTLDSKSSILSLNPFIDEQGLIRVGGRLSHSKFPFDKRHPILLPKHNRLTEMLFQETHVKLLHAGTTALLNAVRERFWPMSGKSTARKIVRNCVKCVRFNPTQLNPMMGNLPKARVTIMPPFTNVGVDYAGPIIIKDRAGRNCKKVKAYICLFICFSVKAIHLEIVSSLSADAFLTAFRRFIARRGKPQNIYSDNGTNFRGANTELKELYAELNSKQVMINDSLTQEGVNWHFIPPHAPHFGGLWEAGVKSAKLYLRKILAETSLNYEELSTVIAQIEAILNSRPLCPLSPDPNDLQALTPAHFLIGHQYTALVDPNVTDQQVNRLNRFQYLQRLNQDFWKRWSSEYISELQHRHKWQRMKPDVAVNSLVLVKEDGTSPAAWKLGKIIKVYPGRDGIVRAADVKCSDVVIKRPIVKLCVLPVETQNM